MGEKKHTHLWCPKIKSTQVVKNYILEAQRIIVHLCVCIYTANVLLLYYNDVPGFYCLALDIVYTMNVLQHRNMIMAGKWYIDCVRVCLHWNAWMCVYLRTYVRMCSLFLLWKMLRLWNKFVLSCPGELDQWKVWIRAKFKA